MVPTELSARQKTLLMFLRPGGRAEVDPVRIMKGMFIIAQEAPAEWLDPNERYQFQPYNYGPCSTEVYGDLDALGRYGLLEAREQMGRSWKYYSLSPLGITIAEAAAEGLARPLVDYIAKVREFVTALGFNQLLRVVYARWPEYAVNSVFQDPAARPR